jgi:hypothetical protein
MRASMCSDMPVSWRSWRWGRAIIATSQARLQGRTRAKGADIRVITSAGALVDSLHHMGIGKIALVAPYMKPLTQTVVDYIEAEGIKWSTMSPWKSPTTSTWLATIRRAFPISWRGSICRRPKPSCCRLRADAFAARDPHGRGALWQAGRDGGRRHDLPDAARARPRTVRARAGALLSGAY